MAKTKAVPVKDLGKVIMKKPNKGDGKRDPIKIYDSEAYAKALKQNKGK
jgi:hypothetical protein